MLILDLSDGVALGIYWKFLNFFQKLYKYEVELAVESDDGFFFIYMRNTIY